MQMKFLIYLLAIVILSIYCSAQMWGPVFEIGEKNCTDTIDNDGDGDTDKVDPDCWSIIYGNVTDSSGKPIDNARVDLITKDYSYTTYTAPSGRYYREVNISKDENYNLVASKGALGPSTYTKFINFSEMHEINFTLALSNSNCQADCTRTGSDICDLSCLHFNNCNNPIGYDTLSVCNGYANFHTIEYNSTHKVKCCKGSPYKTSNLQENLDVSTDVTNLITIKRIIVLNGVPVELNVVTYTN